MISSNPKYTLRIKRGGKETVTANLPEDLSTTLSSEYRSIWDATGFGNKDSKLNQANTLFGVVGGMKIAPGKVANQLIWESTDALEIQTTLKFVANTNAEQDVMRPLRLLSAFSVPEVINNDNDQIARLIKTNNQELEEDKIIMVEVGQYLILDRVVIPEVQITWNNRIAQDGFPISASAQVTMRSAYIMFQHDILKAFQGSDLDLNPRFLEEAGPNSIMV